MNQPITHLEPVTASARRFSARQLAGAAVVTAALVAGGLYWLLSPDTVSTDNAYVNGPVVNITAEVSGPVATLAVQDNQQVQPGDLLLQVDPRPYQIALDQAEATLALARQGVNQGDAAVQAAEADALQDRSTLVQARADAARAHELAPKGFLSQADVEKADTQVRTDTAQLQSSEAKLAQARAQLGHRGDANENVKAAQAAVAAAQLKLALTRVVAPFAGTVSNLSLQPGSMVQAGLPLFAVIGSSRVWVDANFKETQFHRLHPGLKAEVRLDMYPGRVFHGTVQSISGGSGTAFSLLPPQNATGNWVKVTQRVPVKIVIDDADPHMPLRIGTSADVKVFL